MLGNKVELSNGMVMPSLLQGLPLIGGLARIGKTEFLEIVKNTMTAGVFGFDTSHDYGMSERYLKTAFKQLANMGYSRNDYFVVSKIGNSQQYEGNIDKYVDNSLKTMGLDYIDLMLLHWPTPGYYIDNWKKLEKAYNDGRVKSIGIANAQVRHLQALMDSDIHVIPHVVQTEIHPFNTCRDVRNYCQKNKIALQSCSSLCCMIEKVKKNPLLNELSGAYHRSIAQIMLRWLLQVDVVPVFRAFKEKHVKEITSLFDFQLSQSDMDRIENLNEDYRYHPESLNCAGF